MIMVISMRNAFLVPIIFTILPSLHPPSFHEMIFILVYIAFSRARPVTFLSVTSTHVMPTFARSARNNCIPKRDTYIHKYKNHFMGM